MVSIRLWRDYPAEGWHSMNRYAESLYLAFIQEALSADIDMFMPPDPWPGKFGVVASRFLRYPIWMRHNLGDINHILDHSYGHLCRVSRGKTLVTVHDLAPLLYNRTYGISRLIWRFSIQGIVRADKVITDSHFTANELTKLVRRLPSSVIAIPLGVSEAFKPMPTAERQALHTLNNPEKRPFILHVGNWQPRKNPKGILQTVKELKQRNLIVQLVQAGANPSRELLREIDQMDLLDQVFFMGHVSEQELVKLYNAADLLLFPSLYEGFGLPVLEAMACGTPVVTSNSTSLPETAGGAAVLVDPADIRAMADSVENVLVDQAIRDRLIEAGLTRARALSWRNTAHQVYREYQALLS